MSTGGLVDATGRHVVVLSHPEAGVAELLGALGEGRRVGQRRGAGPAVSHDGEVEHGQRDARGVHVPDCMGVIHSRMPGGHAGMAAAFQETV